MRILKEVCTMRWNVICFLAGGVIGFLASAILSAGVIADLRETLTRQHDFVQDYCKGKGEDQ